MARVSRSRTRSRSGGNRRRASPPPQQSTLSLWTKRLLLWGTGFVVLMALFTAFAVAFAMRDLPSYSTLKASQSGQTIIVRARDGSSVVELGPSYGQWLDSEEIPDIMKEAMIAVEDRRFYQHPGVDPIGLMRAVYVWATGDKRLGATSTITQQLARNLFLNTNRTVDRKAREMVLAMALEAKFTKQQILELYLNKVYFGGGAYGVDSASRRFFSHPATDLSVGEAAIIAGLVKAPSRYSPTADVDAAVSRARTVLRLMSDQGRITPYEAQVDVSAVQLREQRASNAVRYFSDWVLPQLDVLLPETFEPIEVWTTIDPKLQTEAIEAIRANAPGGAQGALVSLDRDGAILAMVGGTDYVQTNYNRAVSSLRQPGSAWKLFVYLAALEAGYTPDDTVVDTPVTIDGWSPRNSGGTYGGEMSLRAAFAYSKNTVAAQLGNEVGFGTVASMARRFGITTPISTYPSMVLGSSEARVLDMTRAFAGISAGGKAVEPYGILKVTTADGDVLYQHRNRSTTQLVPDYVAKGITDLLQTTVNTGTGRAAQIGRPVAGKTGTTNSNKDGWFLGFSSGITTGVWMGRDDAKAVNGLQGGTAPAKAFAQFMRVAVKDRPVEQLDTQLNLPEWQIEPDDEYFFGDPEDYYFIDEDGNLIEPGAGYRDGDTPFDVEGERRPGERAPGERPPRRPVDEDFLGQQPPAPNPSGSPGARQVPTTPPAPAPQSSRGARATPIPQAASNDFLERATGREIPDQ